MTLFKTFIHFFENNSFHKSLKDLNISLHFLEYIQYVKINFEYNPFELRLIPPINFMIQ